MNFNTIVEAGATLRDPYYAFGFVTTVVLLIVASAGSVFLWRSGKRQALSVGAALIAILVVLNTRRAISWLANVAVRMSGSDDVVIHYWYSSPYVWTAWALTCAAVAAAVVIRTRRQRAVQHGA